MSKIVEVQHVSKEYPLGSTKVRALEDVSLAIEKGAFLSIIGPSGSGKTTLLNIIGLIDTLTEGEVLIDGMAISSLSDRERTNMRLFKLGFIFQTFNLIPVLDLVENVEYPLLLQKKLSKKAMREKALAIIEEVGLQEHIHHRPYELSGGQRQRVAIARALVSAPAIVLADEPTANLDTRTGNAILDLMQEMNQKSATTFIFSTHDPEVLKYAKDKVALRDGMVIPQT